VRNLRDAEHQRTLSGKRLELVQGDVTAQDTDAIVNAANAHLRPGAGVCGAIRRAGGPSIFDECARLVADRGPLAPGEAAITGAGSLACRHVIHAVGPVWQGGSAGEPLALASCYRTSLRLAAERGLQSIAFPSISTGIYGYPLIPAATVAVGAVRDHMRELALPSLVRLVLWSEDDLAAYAGALASLKD
jgi:O-acetyl-ADP-ribose deacetylase (regulator of RNase III)